MSDVPMEVDNVVGAYADTNDHDLKDLVREVFDEYITNEIPIRLLYITEDLRQIRFKLVDRIFIKEYFASVPDEIYRVLWQNACGPGGQYQSGGEEKAQICHLLA